ncbi:3-deoxy-D-manno-octulosonic acid transferase [Pseudoruegeria aquimaris]|uniref:3-deoxy-D-manno-octulosonic acid transferase n=1 Tax=Pseudoruegeria aquimaris TaxID=393663 RepID=A0A1Y5RJG9_9RHOB|nr:glycosyltransferase N-terminal domain-containing protein [Pseudoruegeria aquimaris]SLN18964.1 3-deoxy-D-manno-octulosonic acid transferase [Pseudoruegeria aquimaris]
MLSAYLGFARVSGPLWRRAMAGRVKKGKLAADRVDERFARNLPARPQGPLLWFHALSVGESLALLPLIERAGQALPEAHFLLTTTTQTSADALARVGLPPRCRHQFLPVDTRAAVTRFLDHWQPVVAVFSEMDFWPAVIVEADRRGIPLALINSRFYARSVESRGKLRGLYADVLSRFSTCLVQDAESARHFADFGVAPERISVTGALKGAARPLAADPDTLAELRTRIGARPVWLAAATEAAEDAAMLAAHAALRESFPDALLIIAPRNIGVGPEVAAQARARFGAAGLRSAGEPPDGAMAVYVADTLGEMGLWYRLAQVAFIGHSLPVREVPYLGKNPFEAAALGCVILHGPQVEDFAESYAQLDAAGAAIAVADAQALPKAVMAGLDPERRAALTTAARGVIEARGRVLEETWQAIAALVPARSESGARGG